jgi:hypothetical protein
MNVPANCDEKGVRNEMRGVLSYKKSDCGTCYWSVDTQDVGLCAEQLRRLVNDIQGVLLLYAALAIEVVFQERGMSGLILSVFEKN